MCFTKNQNTYETENLDRIRSGKRNEILALLPKVLVEIDRRLVAVYAKSDKREYRRLRTKLRKLELEFADKGWFNVELPDLLDISQEESLTQKLVLRKLGFITLFALLCSVESASSIKATFAKYGVRPPLFFDLFFEHRHKKLRADVELSATGVRPAFVFRLGEASGA